MTVIPGIPKAPKGLYRPTPLDYANRPDSIHDPVLAQDPYLHPSHAKAFRRPASPIEEGRFDPNIHATSLRRSRSVSRQNTSSSGHSRSHSVPVVPPPTPPAISRPTSKGHRRHGSSGSATSHASSKGSSPSVHSAHGSPAPSSVSSLGPPPPLAIPPPPTAAPIPVPVFPVYDPEPLRPEDDPVAAILQGSTRAGKLTKRRRSDKTMTSTKSATKSITKSDVRELPSPSSPTTPVKSRSGFRFRFGKAAAGRVPAEPHPDVMLPPERRPSERDIGEPSGRFLSPASSFVILDGPPTPPLEPVPLVRVGPRIRNSVVQAPPRWIDPAELASQNGSLRNLAQNKADLDKIDALDDSDPYGLAWHTRGPYDAVGSVIGSQRGSRFGGSQIGVGSPPGMMNMRTQLPPPSITGSSVRNGHRVYPGIGTPAASQPVLPVMSPYPPQMQFIAEALPQAQAMQYSEASHSPVGSSGSPHSAPRHSPTSAQHSPGHSPLNSDGESPSRGHHREPVGSFPDSQYRDGHMQEQSYGDSLYERPHSRLPSDDFYAGQQPQFGAHHEDRSLSQREDGQWDQDHASEDGAFYHRRSRDEEMKFVPMRQPIVSPANDVQSHYGHESRTFSEHRSHRSGGAGSILSGSSAGRAALPPKHHPKSLVMPSPLQGPAGLLPSNGSPPYAGRGPSRSPVQQRYLGTGGNSREHSRVRASMASGAAPSWNSQTLMPSHAAVIPMSNGKGGRLYR